MTISTKIRNLSTLSTLIVLAACGTELNAPDTEEEQINLDVATYAAEATADDIVLLTSEADEMLRPGLHNRTGCRRLLGLFRVRCIPRRFGDDLTISREVTFYDSLGNVQEVFDSVETDAVNIVATFLGERTRENMTVAVNRTSDMTISGLYGAETERTSNGTATASVFRTRHSDENGDRTYDMSSTTTVAEVVLAVPRHRTWPLSGIITRDVTVEIVDGLEDPRTRTRTVIIEFNGTRFVPMSVNGELFTLDLATREIVQDNL